MNTCEQWQCECLPLLTCEANPYKIWAHVLPHLDSRLNSGSDLLPVAGRATNPPGRRRVLWKWSGFCALLMDRALVGAFGHTTQFTPLGRPSSPALSFSLLMCGGCLSIDSLLSILVLNNLPLRPGWLSLAVSFHFTACHTHVWRSMLCSGNMKGNPAVGFIAIIATPAHLSHFTGL